MKIPSVLLIGAGRFGTKHLQKLLQLQKEGLLSLAGAIVTTPETQKKIAKQYKMRVWTELSDELLSVVDAVDIVTPPETHKELVLRCLPFVDVLVEKPLAMNSRDARMLAKAAKKFRRTLMVGHIFRFDPVVKKLKGILTPFRNEAMLIRGEFVNHFSNDTGRDIALELPHLFDIVDWVVNEPIVEVVSTRNGGRVNVTEIKYRKGKHAIFRIGWHSAEKKRSILFSFSDKEIRCDLLNRSVEILHRKTGVLNRIDCGTVDPLTEEIAHFLTVLRDKRVAYPDAQAGIRLVEVAERAGFQNKLKKACPRPRVAVLGAGIFGTNCAIALGEFCDVTLFEKNDDIMQEASFVNQYRHHWGYHYPRSDDTVHDIRHAIADFEHLYNDAVLRDFPTYYLIAKSGSKVSPKEYLQFCRKHRLPFTKEFPAKEYVDRTKVSLSLKTLEPIYNHKRLKGLVHAYLEGSPHITLWLGTEVTGGKIEKDGSKTLTLKKGNKKYTGSFDYVINATYAQYNTFLHWFNFPIKPVRVDLVEALIVKLPLPKISLAVMDGPFTNLVPTSEDHLFTLVHIRESILERYVPKNGLPNKKRTAKTAVLKTLKKSAEWFPILAQAEVVDVRYVFRAVQAHHEHDDARPSDVTYHGFGTWSVLGGKIVNSVTTAKQIASQIREHMS